MERGINVCVLVLLVIQTLIGRSLEIIDSHVIQVWSAPGGLTRLPCDLAAPVSDVAMMLWFKDGDKMPIYTVDFRNGPPVHWAVAGEFGTRTHFVLNESDPSSAHLSVEKVAHQDEGLYRCRIDYVDSPTRNYRVNLTVIVPPESPRIYDSEGREILGSIGGPFREGQDLLLSCQAAGGKPPPDVSWWNGNDRLGITKGGSVCQLMLQSLSREMSGTRLHCKVEPPLLQPIVREVTLKLFLKPQFVRVSGRGAVRAGQDRSFVCTTRGSKPAPNIDWFINSQLVDSTLTQMDVDGEVTKSELTWHVRREDSGRQLVCRVSNPWFPAYTLEDSVMLDVMYAPVAQISLIEPKDPRMLREDENAELLCSADASPPATNFTFYKGTEVHLIRDDPIGGIAVEGSKLLLRGLRRHHSAIYRCRARNSEGSALSEPLTLNVLSRPECAAGSVVQQLAGAPGGEVRARCSVSAPSTRDAGPLRFYWTYNGTRDVLPIPASNVTVMGSSSTVIHGLPPDNVDEDLGWLACWASNDIGNQREPCLFRIMPAALPEPPNNCEIENEVLRCEPGHDGGLAQRFLLEALEVRPSVPVQDNEISTLNDQGISGRGLSEAVYRVRNDKPQFALDALNPGRYTLLVYSETPRGRSPKPAALHSVTIRTSDDMDVPASNVTVMGSSSTVIHGLPPDNVDEDLGWLACWASNDIGNQREPCLFRIMPAALPEPPNNCEIENEVLRCEPGHDGGLAQRFLLEALEVRPSVPVQDNEISTLNDQGISGRGLSEAVYRVRNDKPQFALDALNPGRYTLLVYSETPRGRSPKPAALHSVTIRTSDDMDVPGSLQTMTPAAPPPSVTDNGVALLTGAALSLVLLTILTTLCVTLVVMCKKKSQPRRDPEQSTILRRNVGVSMYGGSSISPSVVPTVVVRGHRGSRVLAARWSGVLDDTPLAVLALDTRPHESDSSHSDIEQETELTRHMDHMETQTDS